MKIPFFVSTNSHLADKMVKKLTHCRVAKHGNFRQKVITKEEKVGYLGVPTVVKEAMTTNPMRFYEEFIENLDKDEKNKLGN